jgi:signal peptidase complex subunit 1
LVIPAWPYLKKNPIKWLPSREKLAAAAAATSKQESSTSDLKDKKTA